MGKIVGRKVPLTMLIYRTLMENKKLVKLIFKYFFIITD